MKRIVFALWVISGLILSSGGAVAAQSSLKSQTSDSPGLDQLATTVLEADPEALGEAIQTPPTDDELPDGFTAPVDGVPRNQQLVEAFANEFENTPGAVTSAIHGIDTVPAEFPGAMSGAILTYVVAEEAITDEHIGGFETAFAANIDSPQISNGSVERIDLDGTEGVLVNAIIEQGSAVASMQVVIVPIGNVVIVSTVISIEIEAIPAQDLLGFTSDLAIAGAIHVAGLAADI